LERTPALALSAPRSPASRPDLLPAPTHWDEHPIALADGRRLRSVSAAAGRARVRAGMTVAEARAMCADLEVLDWDEMAILHAITEMSAAFLAGSPQVTPVAGAPGMWWVGAGGFDGIGGERALLYDLVRIARRWHPRPRVAIADSCIAARAATWASRDPSLESAATDRPSSIFIVPPAGCAAYLETAPLALVPMDDELRATLDALGLHTAGAFAALSAEDVERRWGEVGLAAWRLARGEDQRRPVLLRSEGRRAVSVELASPAETMEPVLFLVRAALDRLVGELVSDGRAAAAVAITLTLDVATSALPSGGAPHTVTREVRPARPLGRTTPLFERCRALLDGWMPGAPVCGVAVAIVATAPLSGEQGDLLAQGWRDPAAIDAALARLRAELGPNVVVRPVARDEHRPERTGVWMDIEAVQDGGKGNEGRGTEDREVALRLLEQPEQVEVEGADRVAVALWWRGRRISIDRAIGPERLSGDWWKDGYRRDYWRYEAEGSELLVFQSSNGWFIQGWYD
jgi:protein ImuB